MNDATYRHPRGRDHFAEAPPSYGRFSDDKGTVSRRALRAGDAVRIGNASGARGVILQVVDRGVIVEWLANGVSRTGRFEMHQVHPE